MNKIKCPNCGHYRFMDRRRAFAMSYGAFCAVTGAVATGCAAILHHPLATWIFAGIACGGSLIIFSSRLILRPQGQQTCMNCGYKLDI